MALKTALIGLEEYLVSSIGFEKYLLNISHLKGLENTMTLPVSLEFCNIREKLDAEVKILDRLVYRSKNQHKSSLMLRKMICLKRVLRIETLSIKDKARIGNCARDLYIVASANVCEGFFLPLCMCVLGVCARIFYLIEKCNPKQESNKIDEIFSTLG